MTIPPAPVAPSAVQPVYAGRPGVLLVMVLRGLALMTLTLGLHRFWMQARVRRFYWSSVRLQGEPFEFTGTGFEMLMGFLVAVVLLASYLAAVNLALVFAGFAVLDSPLAANLPLLALLPLSIIASYRGRRYLLARTRWRGIRFGMEPGAVTYMRLTLGYLVVAVLTLGVLVPLLDFRRRQFVMDRTRFGTLAFRQEGSWSGLLAPWLWVIGAATALAAGAYLAEASGLSGAWVIAAVAGVPILGFLYQRYAVLSFRYLTAHTVLGEGVRFGSAMRTGRILGIVLPGFALVVALMLLVVFGLVTLGVAVAATLGADLAFLGLVLAGEPMGGRLPTDLDVAIAVAISALSYLAAFLVGTAVTEVVVTQRVLRHQVETLSVLSIAGLDAARQRPEDRAREAAGLADALDVGAGL